MSDDLVLKASLDTSGVHAAGRLLKSDIHDLAERSKKLTEGLRQAGEIGLFGVGAFKAGEAVKSMAEMVMRAGSEIADGSKRLGVSAYEYQKLSSAAKQTGTDGTVLINVFKSMLTLIDEAGKGSEESAKKLAALGFTYQDLRGLSPERQFAKIAEEISKIEDPASRATMATEVFGKSGLSIMPMITEYGELARSFEDLGAAMGDKAVEAAERFEKSVVKLKAALISTISDTGFVEWLAELAGTYEVLRKANTDTKKENMTGLYTSKSYGAARFTQDWAGALFGLTTADLEATAKGKNSEMVTSPFNQTEWDKYHSQFPDKSGDERARERAEAEQKKREELEAIKNAKEIAQEKKEIAKLDEEITREGSRQASEAAEADARKTLQDSEKTRREVEYMQAKREEIEIQRMINDGDERGARMKEEYNRAIKAGLPKEDAARASDMAGQLYDLREKPAKGEALRMPDYTDSLLRIGGRIGGAPSADPLSLQRKANETSDLILRAVREQTAKWDRYEMRESGG